MPGSTGIAAFLEIESYEAADFSVCVFKLEIDTSEVIHFSSLVPSKEDFA
jgi:hypothetical protein